MYDLLYIERICRLDFGKTNRVMLLPTAIRGEPCLERDASQIASSFINPTWLVEGMQKPIVRITLESGNVNVLTPNVRVEVRDYDIIEGIGKHKQLWAGEQGGACLRYFAFSKGSQDALDSVVDNLERFRDNLGFYAGILATVTPDSSPDGLQVMTINNIDFYFEVGSGKHDGWRRTIGHGGSKAS